MPTRRSKNQVSHAFEISIDIISLKREGFAFAGAVTEKHRVRGLKTHWETILFSIALARDIFVIVFFGLWPSNVKRASFQTINRLLRK
jgi:hypothetical protein